MKPGSIYKYDFGHTVRPRGTEKFLFIAIKKNLKFTGHWLLYDVKKGGLVHTTADWSKLNLTEAS